MPIARKVAVRVNGARVANARVRRSQNGPELVIADPLVGEFVIDESFTVETAGVCTPGRNPKQAAKQRLEASFAADIDCDAGEWCRPCGRGELKSIGEMGRVAPQPVRRWDG